jgi:hypothetical protein
VGCGVGVVEVWVCVDINPSQHIRQIYRKSTRRMFSGTFLGSRESVIRKAREYSLPQWSRTLVEQLRSLKNS